MLIDELLKLKNKAFIFECIKIIMKRNNPNDIQILTDANRCKTLFDMNYPILQEVNESGSVDKSLFIDNCGNRRYYPNVITINGKRYIVCNDWYYNCKINKRDTRTAFVQWVLK